MLIKIILLLFILSATFACSTKKPWQEKVDKKIAKMNQGVTVNKIDLDQIDSVKLHPIKTIKFIDTRSKSIVDSPISIITLNDSLYILDQAQNSIFVANKSGNIKRKMAKQGKGPGEFMRPTGMATNGKRVFICDSKNERINMYDEKFHPLISIPAIPMVTGKNMTVSDSILYFFDRSSPTNSNDLVEQYSIYPTLKEKGHLIPRLLPLGQQPIVVNNVVFDANSEGYLVAGYQSLFHLFLYTSNRKLIHSIKLSGGSVQKAKEIKKEDDRTHPRHAKISMTPFIYTLLLDDHLNIYLFTLNNHLYVFGLKDNNYKLVGNYVLKYSGKFGLRSRLSFFKGFIALVARNRKNVTLYKIPQLDS